MNKHLEQFIKEIINEDTLAAKKSYSVYFNERSEQLLNTVTEETIKPTYDWEVQGLFDGEWEMVNTFSGDDRRSALKSIKEYRDNDPKTAYRLRKVKVTMDEGIMVPDRMRQDYEARAQAERKAGGSVEIVWALPTVTVTLSDGSEYFFQEHEASELLDEVPDNMVPEDYILAAAQNW